MRPGNIRNRRKSKSVPHVPSTVTSRAKRDEAILGRVLLFIDPLYPILMMFSDMGLISRYVAKTLLKSLNFEAMR